ncbi:MAG TPA: ribosomal biogenesis protein [Thermoplasmata archaeon]|nr:ribosomal biogenesis protein [Thermoplasmata archaeon]
MQLVTTWFGAFLLDEGKVVRQLLFPKDPAVIARRLQTVDAWKVLDEERELLKAAPEVFVTEPRLERAGGKMTQAPPPFLRAEEFGFDRKLLHEAMVTLAKAQMRRAPTADDHLAQAVATLDDVTESHNLLLERLREWYGLHFPELAKVVDDREYTQLIAGHGDRGSMPREFGDSIGGEIGPAERAGYMDLAATASGLAAQREGLLTYVERSVTAMAPNLARLVGPTLGARLIALAGGLSELARMPTSTIQVLGAEKAFFRHLKDHTPPPKHGVLFQHVWIHGAPPWQRGSLARVLAGRIAIAARADFYTKRDLGDSLQRDLERAFAGIAARKKGPKPGWAARKPRARRR